MISQTTAADNVPTDEEYERLLITAKSLQDPTKRTKALFMLRTTGELGFRSGELLHFRPSWLDRTRKVIEIPIHDDCRCSYCQLRAERAAENNDVTVEEALDAYWQPKYRASHRTIPYNHSDRTIEVVEKFADMVGNYDCAQSTINRRLGRLVTAANVNPDIHPHALRAYAALWWARQGLEAAFLQGLMGWNDMRVAVRYIQASGTQLKQRMEEVTKPNDISDGEHIADFTSDPVHDTTEVVSEARAVQSAFEHPRSRDATLSPKQTEATDTSPSDLPQSSLFSYTDV